MDSIALDVSHVKSDGKPCSPPKMIHSHQSQNRFVIIDDVVSIEKAYQLVNNTYMNFIGASESAGVSRTTTGKTVFQTGEPW